MKRPLTPSILRDPDHEFVKTLLYVYTMESFVFSEMNKAARMKDVSKIELYGPFASALSFIVYQGNIGGEPMPRRVILYRGIQIPQAKLAEGYQVG